jgi:hypothetical protein
LAALSLWNASATPDPLDEDVDAIYREKDVGVCGGICRTHYATFPYCRHFWCGIFYLCRKNSHLTAYYNLMPII